MSGTLWELILRSALAAEDPELERGPRTWRVRWPTGQIETVREILFPTSEEPAP